ncbi:MAG TPA: arginase [Bryobacteraceae bacterium]|nr:arginase [Bryobacteraceae bacterium]
MRKAKVAVIGAPLDLGAGRRGVDMGVSAIRFANLGQRLRDLGYRVADLGNIPVEQPERVSSGPRNARYLNEIARTCTGLAGSVASALGRGQLPLVLGGDHSIAVGTVSGLAKYYREKKKRVGLLWIDAHADMNTPQTSPSGNVHGMPLACIVGNGPRPLTHIYGFAPKVDPAHVALVGIRDVDALEKPHVRDSGVRAFTMRDIDERGMRAVMAEALEIVSGGTDGFDVSLDMDSVDPEDAPGVGTPVRGGLSYREAHLAMEMIGDSGRMLALEVVEVNPVYDEANRTALLAVELIASAMGKRIL